MRRFFKLMAITMQGRMYYRTSFLLNLVTPLILLAGQYLLWDSLYRLQGGANIGTFSRPEMLSYILVAFAIQNLLTWSSENTLSREIRSGDIVARRMRPVSFLSQSLADMCGNLVLQAVVNGGVVLLAFLLFSSQLATPSLGQLGVFLPCLLLGLLLRMMLVHTFSLLCFYTTSHLGITWTRQAITDFFSGALIPVALFPAWLQSVSYAMPFPLMLQVPIAVLFGQPLPISLPRVFVLQAFWILLLYALHWLLYGHIRKTTTLAGG